MALRNTDFIETTIKEKIMITYLSGIILILVAYYIGQYKGYVKAKSFFQHPDESQKVSTNELTKEVCTHLYCECQLDGTEKCKACGKIID